MRGGYHNRRGIKLGPWVSKSRPGLQFGLSLGSVLVGAVLVFAMRDFRTAGGDAFAGFLLGVLLLVIGVAGALTSGVQTVTVDPNMRRIEIADSCFFGPRRRTAFFDEIGRVSIGYLGKSSNYVKTYYLVLHLANGPEFSLFASGRSFEGSSKRVGVEGWRERLEGYLGTSQTRG